MSKLNPTYIGLEASLLIFFEKKTEQLISYKRRFGD